VKKLGSGDVEVLIAAVLPTIGDSPVTITYTIRPTGDVRVRQSFDKKAKNLQEIVRFGMQMHLPKSFDRVTWYGRGPHENYQDRNSGAGVDLHERTVDGLFVRYSEPQENGYRTDTRWMTIRNEKGTGLLAVGMPLLSFGASHLLHRDQESVRHDWMIPRRDFVVLNLDLEQMGVGGDNSWGARVHPQFTLTDDHYEYAYRLRPLAPGDDPIGLSKQSVFGE
jgi:beta-galactosidase